VVARFSPCAGGGGCAQAFEFQNPLSGGVAEPLHSTIMLSPTTTGPTAKVTTTSPLSRLKKLVGRGGRAAEKETDEGGGDDDGTVPTVVSPISRAAPTSPRGAKAKPASPQGGGHEDSML
jgi:hypothetical protein